MIVLAAFAAYLVATLISARQQTFLLLDDEIEFRRPAPHIPHQTPIVLDADQRLQCALAGAARGFLWPIWLATWFVKLGARFLAAGHSPLEKIEHEKLELQRRERELAERERIIATWQP